MGDLKNIDATPTAMVHIKTIKFGEFKELSNQTEYQLVFSVGVQHFDIGPRYEKSDEAEWFMHQFSNALDEFVKINTGVSLQAKAN